MLLALLEHLPGFVYRYRDDGARLVNYISRNCVDLTGYQPDDFLSGSIATSDLMHPEDRDFVLTDIKKQLSAKGEFDVCHRLVKRDGTIEHVLNKGWHVSSGETEPPFVEGYLTDFVSRRVTESMLRERNNLLLGVLNNIDESVITIDESGIIESVNPAAEKLLGYHDRELVGNKVSIVVPDNEKGAHDAYIRRYVATRKGRIIGAGPRELAIQRKDGHLVPVEIAVSEAVVDQHRIFIGIMRDITERKKNSEHMRKMSSALEHTADSVIICNLRGEIEYVNSAFENTTGYSARDAIGNRPSIVKSGQHDRAFYKRLWNTISAGRVFRDIFINRRKSGEIYYEEKTITPLKDERGEISHYISTGKDITDRVHDQERLQYLAYHDVLTELPNRALLFERLRHAVTLRREKNQMIAVAFLDVDGFKMVNDTLGHDAGDNLIKLLARRLADVVRRGDTIARFGGDEFAFLLEDVSSAEAVSRIAAKILECLSQPFVIDSHDIFITASLGISMFPQDGQDANALIRNADAAMYRAKDLGKNTYQFYSSELSNGAYERLKLQSGLRFALDRAEYQLHYQPLVDVRTSRVVGLEALLRWRHPQFGLTSPIKFIPLLEETGLINSVGLWVLGGAIAQLAEWRKGIDRDLYISVNVSGKQFRDEGLHEEIGSILAKYALPPGALHIEITESVLMQNDLVTRNNINALHRLGVLLSVDDFGTGYSSLGYLKRFPVSTVKIDKSFVQDATTDKEDEAIVKAIIAMGRSLNLNVIAEGVETQDQFELLRKNHCEVVQGYLFSAPAAADDVAGLLRHLRR